MQRRTFIGSILAGLAATSLPAAVLEAPAPAITVWNTATLTEALQRMFVCNMGPAMAFFETNKDGDILHTKAVETRHPQFPNQTVTDYVTEGVADKRYIYYTYVCGVEGGSAEEAEARLAKHFYDEFSKLEHGPLVWRLKPHFESVEITKWGEVWASKEFVEDGLHLVRDKAIPPNVELDTNDDKYKYVLAKTQLHKMRMRLVMPHLYAHPDEEGGPLPHLVKAEGAAFNRMI